MAYQSVHDRLNGKVITGVDISADKLALRLRTTEGDIVAVTDADCCSESWVESIETPARGFPATVFEVVEVPMPDPQDGPQEVTVAYGLRISTDKGEIVIEYRNSSNGYYGGWLCWPDESHEGGVYQQNTPKGEPEWIPVE